MNSTEPLIQVENLSIGFESGGKTLEITEKVSFEILPGETLGLVGESGCGKTVTCLSLLRLLPQPSGKFISGRILFKGRDLLKLSPAELKEIRGKEIGMIFQEPGAALNPLMTVKKQLLECFLYHPFSGNPLERIEYLMRRVGFSDPSRVLKSYPHELSGGMLQRVMITMALLHHPAFLIADEPTTALDVTVQAQIMELLVDLQREFKMSILMITHNLNLVAQYADRVAVMYAGKIVERNTVELFTEKPLHPYSVGLLSALPDLTKERSEIHAIPGQVPKVGNYPEGCRFRDRCPYAFEACSQMPPYFNRNQGEVACFLYDSNTASAYGKENISVNKDDYAVFRKPG